MKKLISWNVNGLRAVMGKNFMEDFKKLDADIFCLQETKLQEGQIELDLPGYFQYWIGIEEHDQEGRVITLEFKDYYLITVYVPNSQNELKRLPYRMEFEDAFLHYILNLEEKKPVVYCGDLNVAHEEIDLKNPDTNHLSAGFSDEERAKFSRVLSSGYLDSFRYFYPDKEEEYSWWSYRTKARDRNVGWRIDYFVVSEKLKDKLLSASIHQEVMGSDHCPVEITLDL